MEFEVGEILIVDGDAYHIIGKIAYRNEFDNCIWQEYRLLSEEAGMDRWLSIDNHYREYSISKAASSVTRSGYHEVDRGREVVVGIWGKVDVEIGDQADFVEYEDRTEEKIISVETWDDGEEISTGYYLDADEISLKYGNRPGSSYPSASHGNKANKFVKAFVVLFFTMVFAMPFLSGVLSGISNRNAIRNYLKESSGYSYVTSITGKDKQKAQVYKSEYYDLDTAAKGIISIIEGNTEDVQQNTEDGDNSIAILTSNEYCLVYEDEKGDVYVQISSRKFAYTTDSEPYNARSGTRIYYRRYYYSRGYYGDSSRYKRFSSPYSSYSDGTIQSNDSDIYSSYSSSVRQESIISRSSSGGGLSSGK